jgi:SAM-dependent methyltransferase
VGPPDAGNVSRNVARGISAMVGELAALKDARQLWFLPNYVGWKPRLYERFFGTLLGAALRTREEASIYGLLGDVLKPGHSVLEVGCGTGNYTVPLAHCCARLVAVDASPEMLRYTRERLDREGLRRVETRLERLPGRLGPARSFDGTLAVGVLNYVQDLEGALRSLTSVLRPGGWTVFNVPARTAEGRIYALAEIANRRRIYLYSLPEIVKLGQKIGLRVEATATAGLSRGGITVVWSVRQSHVPRTRASRSLPASGSSLVLIHPSAWREILRSWTSVLRRSANFGLTEFSKVRIQHPAQPRSYTRGSCVHDGEASQDSVRKTTDRCGATERSRATEFIRTSSRRSILAQAGGNSSPKLCSEQDGGPSCMTNRQLKDRL